MTLSIANSNIWRSMMKKILIILSLLITTITLIGCEAQNLQKQNSPETVQNYDAEVFGIVEEPYRDQVARSFASDAQKIVLDRDLHVYRYWGGGSGESGFYFAKKMYTDRDVAKRMLALPERNTALNVTQYKIPRGTTVIYGTTASMVGEDGFGMEATGGAEQYFLPNPVVAEKELVGKLEYTHHEQTMDELEEVEAVAVD